MSNAYLNQTLKGKTPEQKKVIKYFIPVKGCLPSLIAMISGGLTDSDYDAMIAKKVRGMGFKQRAMDKIGLDESEVNEIEPVNFEGFLFDSKKAYAKKGNDKRWRSSAYQVTWIFFSSTQMYVYQYTLNMNEDGKSESTDEYFYQDITAFSTSSDTVEKRMYDDQLITIDVDRFAIVVPGDKFYCSMDKTEYTERAIKGMKAQLREKKTR